MVQLQTVGSGSHDVHRQKMREADASRIAGLRWLVTGGVTLVTGIVLMFVMDTRQARVHAEQQREEEPRRCDGWGKSHPQDPIKPLSLKEKLSVIEAHLTSAPTKDILFKLFHEVRDAELKGQATAAGGELLTRYDKAAREVARCYVDALRTAATAAASGTTGEALAP